MNEVILTEEQARILSQSRGPVLLRDARGQALAYTAAGFSPAEVEEAERDLLSDQRRYTTAEVLAHLQSLSRP